MEAGLFALCDSGITSARLPQGLPGRLGIFADLMSPMACKPGQSVSSYNVPVLSDGRRGPPHPQGGEQGYPSPYVQPLARNGSRGRCVDRCMYTC